MTVNIEYNEAQKETTDAYREGWDRIWGKKKDEAETKSEKSEDKTDDKSK